MLLFNIAEISKQLQERLGDDVIYPESRLAAADAVIIEPSYQHRVLNFLFYEKKLRFDRLYDMVLNFEPGTNCNHYSMLFQLGSRYYANRLNIFVPFNRHNCRLYSAKHLYNNAAKLEKLMTDIHAVQFTNRSTLIDRVRERVNNLLLLSPE
jgi:NADH:ubiquinone oxidoreductase subunit C